MDQAADCNDLNDSNRSPDSRNSKSPSPCKSSPRKDSSPTPTGNDDNLSDTEADGTKDLSDVSEDELSFRNNKGGPVYGDKNKANNKPLENDEDALDFEAEEGECNDVENKEQQEKKIDLSSENEEGEELEEGEVSDEEDKRPEENEPKPICRFYARGQCTWGISCRFLHPGVTDKGNYTMFDMVRPVPALPAQIGFGQPPFGDGFREMRPSHHHAPPFHGNAYAPIPSRPAIAASDPNSESAWERGLRTAKEMMKKASKRKEQDIDFEDKKMNLSLTQDELERDNYYVNNRSSPEGSHILHDRQVIYSPGGQRNLREDRLGRAPRFGFRELPPHRMPQYEENIKRRSRSTREVIVQRADDWNDPWMRSKSPSRGAKRKSYSSESSYSSSSSSTSQSGSSSDSSRSPSPAKNRRNQRQKSESDQSGPPKKYLRFHSPQRRKPVVATSPKGKRVSPVVQTRGPIKQRSASSSDSSESSASESESSNSSSSESSSSTKNVRSRDVALTERKAGSKRVEKKAAPTEEKTSHNPANKKSNRREELLKQLKAVEDAIARKRSKIN